MSRKHSARLLKVLPSLTSGLTAPEIARRHGIPQSTVYYLAREHGITLPQSDWRRQNMLRLQADPAFKEKLRTSMKERHKDAAFRKRVQEALRASKEQKSQMPEPQSAGSA